MPRDAGQIGVEPVRLVPPIDADEVDWNARGRDEQAHAHLDRAHVQRHEHEKRADEQKDDGNGQVHLEQ